MKKDGLILFYDSSRGVYIPQVFARDINPDVIAHNPQWVLDGIGWLKTAEPGHDDYWEVWDGIVNRLTVWDGPYEYRLYQDGDLWLYCEELMTDDEKLNFFGEEL